MPKQDPNDLIVYLLCLMLVLASLGWILTASHQHDVVYVPADEIHVNGTSP